MHRHDHTRPARPSGARTGHSSPTGDTDSPPEVGAPDVAARALLKAPPDPAGGPTCADTHLYIVKTPGPHTPPRPSALDPGTDEAAARHGALEPLALDRTAWQQYLTRLLTRSERCEVRSPDCLAARWGGVITGHLRRQEISLHHRQPRGMGGTRRYHHHGDGGRLVERLPCLSAMGLLCGTGTTGCHGWIERHRELALLFGWLVPMPLPDRAPTPATDPARVVVLLPDRRRVLLTPHGGYAPAPDGLRWAA